MWEAESVDPPGGDFHGRESKEVDFVSHLGHGTRGRQHPLLSKPSDGYNLSELIFTCFSPTNLKQARKENLKILPYLLAQIQLTFWESSKQFFTSKKLFPRLLPRLRVL